jgi:hypothetical protein
MSIVQPDQIIYFDNLNSIEPEMEQYFQEISEGQASGIKSTNQNRFRLYGIGEFLKSFLINAKITFFRLTSVFGNYLKSQRASILSRKTI